MILLHSFCYPFPSIPSSTGISFFYPSARSRHKNIHVNVILKTFFPSQGGKNPPGFVSYVKLKFCTHRLPEILIFTWGEIAHRVFLSLFFMGIHIWNNNILSTLLLLRPREETLWVAVRNHELSKCKSRKHTKGEDRWVETVNFSEQIVVYGSFYFENETAL